MNDEQIVITDKVWGSEAQIVNNERYCAKLLNIRKGFRSSYHKHVEKKETFICLQGVVHLCVNGEHRILVPQDTLTLDPGDLHYFRGLQDSQILEVSSHHEDQDSIREDESRADPEFLLQREMMPDPEKYPNEFAKLCAPRSESENFIRTLVFLRDKYLAEAPKTVLDTGYGWGMSSLFWLHEFPDAQVYCIDPVLPGQYSNAEDPISNMDESYTQRFDFALGRCEDLSAIFENQRFDLIMFDADHQYPSTLQQLRALVPSLNPHGILIGHDFAKIEVQKSLHEFMIETQDRYKVEVLPGADNCGWFVLWEESDAQSKE